GLHAQRRAEPVIAGRVLGPPASAPLRRLDCPGGRVSARGALVLVVREPHPCRDRPHEPFPAVRIRGGGGGEVLEGAARGRKGALREEGVPLREEPVDVLRPVPSRPAQDLRESGRLLERVRAAREQGRRRREEGDDGERDADHPSEPASHEGALLTPRNLSQKARGARAGRARRSCMLPRMSGTVTEGRLAPFSRFVIARRWWVLALSALILPPAVVYATRVGQDNALERLIVTSDPDYVATKEFEKVFGSGAYIVLLAQAPDIFAPDVL